MLSKHMFPLFLLVCLSFFPSSSCLHFQNVQTMFRLGEMRSHLVYFVTSLGRKDTPFTEGILEILVMMAVEWLVGGIVFFYPSCLLSLPFLSFHLLSHTGESSLHSSLLLLLLLLFDFTQPTKKITSRTVSLSDKLFPTLFVLLFRCIFFFLVSLF